MRAVFTRVTGTAILLVGSSVCVDAQTYQDLGEFRRSGGEALIGPIDESITGYFSALERFSFANLDPNLRSLSSGGSAFPTFQSFADEARATVDGVPFPSGSTSVAYTYDDKLETWVRWERPLAPSLSQNARTNGRRVLTLGGAYSYVDYTHFDDSDLRQVSFSAGDIDVAFADGSTGRARDVLLSEVNLRENVWAFSMQLGLLDNLDVGVFIPIVDLHFRANGIDRYFLENPDGTLTPADVSTDAQGNCCIFTADPAVPRYGQVQDVDRRAYANVSYTGIRFGKDELDIGDVQFRTKYFFGTLGPADLGFLLNVLTPTGDEDNLFGVGSWRFEPRLILSAAQSRVAGHVNFGYHADADDHDRDRFDYSVGGELLLTRRIALLVDQVSRVGIAGDPQVRKFEIVPGIKVNVFRDAVVGFNAVVPLNREGLTTDYTPNVVVDATIVF